MIRKYISSSLRTSNIFIAMRMKDFPFLCFQTTNSVYKFLSGVKVTPNTPFLLPANSSYQQETSSSSQNASSTISESHNINPTLHTNGESTPWNNKKSCRDDTQTVSEAYRYMHYAMGIYGWPMYLRQNTGMATCRLCSSLRFVQNYIV